MKKYRYYVGGSVFGTKEVAGTNDTQEYDIEIPTEPLYETEEEAKRGGVGGYRFIKFSDASEPCIAVYESESFNVTKENGFRIWTSGRIIRTITYKEFKEQGGILRKLKRGYEHDVWRKPEMYEETKETFSDMFPDMEINKNYYIDNEYYDIREVDEK